MSCRGRPVTVVVSKSQGVFRKSQAVWLKNDWEVIGMKVDRPFPLELSGLEIVPLVDDAIIPEPIIRHADELMDFLLDAEGVNPHTEVLSVYRGVYLKKDADKFNSIRYDLTVVLPGNLAKEKNKTLTHYHNDYSPGLSYPEVYEVLSGLGHFILQRPPERGGPDVVLTEARAGEGFVIPPNYGHVSINPSGDLLLYANLICQKTVALLDEMKQNRGAAYYELEDGSLVKNSRYEWKAALRRTKGTPEWSDLYEQFVAKPSSFSFLCNPTLSPESSSRRV